MRADESMPEDPMDRGIISGGVWKGWRYDEAARAVEWQVRGYAYENDEDGALRAAWERFEESGALPQIPELARAALAMDLHRPGRSTEEWPWVMRLRAIPIPWRTAQTHRAPGGVILVGPGGGTGRTDENGLLLDGVWRGFRVEEAALWADRFFARRMNRSGRPEWVRFYDTEGLRFRVDGHLPRIATWAPRAALLDAGEVRAH